MTVAEAPFGFRSEDNMMTVAEAPFGFRSEPVWKTGRKDLG
jgi:hypothetical protein